MANAVPSAITMTPVQRWSSEIEAAEKAGGKWSKFIQRGRTVVRRYIDERDAMDAQSKWFNIFYANTQILESAVYAQLPKPTVSRKYTDYQDDVARVAALIIERCITQDLDDPCDTFDATMRSCVQDRLVPGMGQAWCRLETDTEELSVPPINGEAEESEAEEAEEIPGQRITDQRVVVDYIFWEDFLMSPCRVYEERRWVARKVYMTREELVKRFGEVKGRQCPLDADQYSRLYGTEGISNTQVDEVNGRARIYEIWDRTTHKVFWYSRACSFMLDEKDDFLKLKGFDPCPRPMFANISTSDSTPRPDYYMLQDQYSELDTVNNRISMLIQACKVIGVYDKAATGVSAMLKEGFDNQLIPVDNWAMFAEKQGLKGSIDWLPLEAVVQALTQLNLHREAIKGQIYELTGIADIVRGATKASETLGAQQIKAQFASVRIKKLQDEVARFAADILRIKAEIVVKHFEPEYLIAKSNVASTGNDEWIGPAIDLLKSEEGFEWRIQVSADTLAQADYAMEKSDRLEFMNVFSKYVASMIPMLEQAPGTASMFVNVLKWVISGFRNAKAIEGMLDRELDILENQAKKPPAPPPPDPEIQKAQMEMQNMQQKAELDTQAKQQDMAMKEKIAQMEIQMKMMDLEFKEKELELKEREFTMKLQFAEAEAARNERTAVIEQQMHLTAQVQQHEQKTEFAGEAHELKMKQAAQANKEGNDE